MENNYKKDEIAKLCEIALIYGQLLEREQVISFDDLNEAYEHFENIYKDWLNLKDIQNDSEMGYITEYANRVILEKYKI